MTAVIKAIEKYARNQQVEFEPHPSYYFGTLQVGRHSIVIGDTGDTVEFTAQVFPDFSSPSLEQLPSNFSSLLLRRNQDIYPAHWAIEYGSDSKEYFYCCKAVISHSKLSEQTFSSIGKVLFTECGFYLAALNEYG